jgi:hypothetical protein
VVESYGYPTTLAVDCLAGLGCLVMLPFVVPRPDDPSDSAPVPGGPHGPGHLDPPNPYATAELTTA